MDTAQVIVLAVLMRVLFGHRTIGDHFGLPVPTDWGRVGAATVGVVTAAGCSWLLYGPGWLPSWAFVGVGFAAGGVCEIVHGRNR